MCAETIGEDPLNLFFLMAGAQPTTKMAPTSLVHIAPTSLILGVSIHRSSLGCHQLTTTI